MSVGDMTILLSVAVIVVFVVVIVCVKAPALLAPPQGVMAATTHPLPSITNLLVLHHNVMFTMSGFVFVFQASAYMCCMWEVSLQG